MEVLGFVYVYYFITAALAMGLFAAFVLLARRHKSKFYTGISIAVRVVLAVFLGGLSLFASYFALAYSFMTSPVILYAFTLVLLPGLFQRSVLFNQVNNWSIQSSSSTDF